MAKKKKSLRQRLIGLLYLVLLSMVALNVSKEVLSGFGQVNDTLEVANNNILDNNTLEYASIANPSKKDISEKSNLLYTRIQEIKDMITADLKEDDPNLKDYESMDSSDVLDNYFFGGGDITAEGKSFVNNINAYRNFVVEYLNALDPNLGKLAEQRFDTSDKINSKTGIKEGWLSNNFEGFPLVSSLSKLSLLQNSIRLTEQDIINTLKKTTLKENLEKKIKEYDFEIEKSKALDGAIYNSKMNVVYRALKNPIKVVIPGVPANATKVYGNGVKRAKGDGNYTVTPGRGKTIDIKAQGTLPDGTVVKVSETFRIKSIPRPEVLFRGQESGKMTKEGFSRGSFDVVFPDFDYAVEAEVYSFTVYVPGHPTVRVNGNKLNERAIKTIQRARSGSEVRFIGVKVTSDLTLENGRKYVFKTAPAIGFEIR